MQLSRYAYHGLIRFSLPTAPVGSKIASAVLRLYADQTLQGSYVVSSGSTGWIETSTTYDNQPTWNSSVLATSGTLVANAYASAPVPVAAVPTSGDVAFDLSTTAGLQAQIETRESSHSPQLVVTYTAPAPSATSPTSPTSVSASPSTGSTTPAATNTPITSTTATPTSVKTTAVTAATTPTAATPTSVKTTAVTAATTATATDSSSSTTAPTTAPPAPAGWVQTFSENFNTPVALGQWPGTYSNQFAEYTNALDTSRNGTYDSTKVVSVHDGMMDFYLHTEAGKHYVAAELPKTAGGNGYDGQISGRYSVRFRADMVAGYKTAWLLWPNSGRWPADGEIDFPEGDLTKTITGASHYSNNGADAFDKFDTQKTFSAWHIATVEWVAGQSVKFYLDGVLIGTSAHAPVTAMHWVLQTETQLSGGAPAAAAAGHVYIDWVSAWKKA